MIDDGTRVDCSAEHLPGLGGLAYDAVHLGFPPDLPQNTAVLLLDGIGLQQADWGAIEALGSSLRALDLGGNPSLDAIHPSGRFKQEQFPKLDSLSLHRTNLSLLQPNTFSDLAERLALLDMSDPE